MKKEHIVRVGPVHAGIIEPGVFRFTCNGERVERLDITLGFQHRGIERLIVQSSADRHRMICLAEQIAGDTTVGHATAMAQILENHNASDTLRSERNIALELERMAMSIGTAAALLGDIAYRIGMTSLQPLRTRTIGTTQIWSGNRFGRTLIRPAGSYYPLTDELIALIDNNTREIAHSVALVGSDVFSSPSVLSRLDDICLMPRDEGIFTGDLHARLKMRFDHVAMAQERIAAQCMWLRENLSRRTHAEPDFSVQLPTDSVLESRTQGWRGEIIHRATTDAQGQIYAYQIIDPSAAAWSALAETMRGEQISDFPVCNKSFNLSYCGVDL